MNEKTVSDQEADMLRLLVSHEEDAEGLLAFALHRRAVHDWMAAYRARESRLPDAMALSSFMLGETTERRLKDYRERANLMLAMPSESVANPVAGNTTAPVNQKTSAKPKTKLRTWFWPWGMSSGFVVENPDQPINWKGLAARLVLLMLAVIVTALMLRFLVVRNI